MNKNQRLTLEAHAKYLRQTKIGRHSNGRLAFLLDQHEIKIHPKWLKLRNISKEKHTELEIQFTEFAKNNGLSEAEISDYLAFDLHEPEFIDIAHEMSYEPSTPELWTLNLSIDVEYSGDGKELIEELDTLMEKTVPKGLGEL